VIHTRSEERAPAYIHPNASIQSSLICDGCIIEPNVVIQNSVLSPGVMIRRGTQVINSIVLTDTVVGEQSVIQKSIIDKHTNVGARSHIGFSDGKKLYFDDREKRITACNTSLKMAVWLVAM
jgi:glucose-1-phosphate adenylyltransferase